MIGAAATQQFNDADVVEFFEFVRSRLDAARRGSDRDRSIGGDASAADEVVRFAAAVGQRYGSDEIVASRAIDNSAVEVTVGFMGLTGPSAVLPEHYSARVVDHRRERDPALGAFFDLFNHRALSHFWRAWAKYRLPVAFESGGGRLDDPFSRALLALTGLGVAGEPVSEQALRPMFGGMTRRVRSATALRRIIAGSYGLPVEIVELEGRWVDLDPADQTQLGSAFATLGVDAVAGAAVWDVGSQFRVRLGPLDFTRFRSFFDADGPRAALTDTIRRAVGGNVDFTIQLVLHRDDVPMLRLDDPSSPAALGQSTWLLAGPAESDRTEAILSSTAPASAGAMLVTKL